MKKILIPIMFLAIVVAFYEETKTEKNIYIIIVAIIIFMLGMMKLSAKTPSKNKHEDNGNI